MWEQSSSSSRSRLPTAHWVALNSISRSGATLKQPSGQETHVPALILSRQPAAHSLSMSSLKVFPLHLPSLLSAPATFLFLSQLSPKRCIIASLSSTPVQHLPHVSASPTRTS